MGASGENLALERRGGVALWRQIADQIRSGLASGLADDHGRLPAELALADHFGVNRHTVRAAIAALTREGVLRGEKGRGTFAVKRKRYAYPIARRTRFSEGLAGQTAQRNVTVLAERIEAAGAEAAAALELAPGEPLARIDLIGEADGIAVSRATHWFEARRFGGIGAAIAGTGSVSAALAAHGIGDYVRQRTVIRAVHATAADTADLGLSPGAVVLETFATNADLDGRPIQYSHTRFAADRMELTVDWTTASWQ